jgi:hypothetical protein
VAARGAGAGITGHCRVDRGAGLWTCSAAVGVAAPLHRPCAGLARPSQVACNIPNFNFVDANKGSR